MIQRSLKKKLYGALIIMGLLAFIFAGFSWVQAIRTRSFTSQTFIHIPRHFFNQLYHPWQRLSFEIDVLPLSHSPALSLTRGQAVLRPKFWNLAANCPRSSNLEIFDTTLESPAWQLLAELLQHWVVNSAYEAKTLKAPLCQHTVVSIFNSKLHIGASPQQNYLVKRFQLRGGAKPHLVIEGGAQGEHPEELGLNLTYRPDLDQGALSAKLGKRGRFEGKIER